MLQQLFFSQNDNCSETLTVFLKTLKVKVSNTTIYKAINYHPDYPSLLSISDILTEYRIANISFQANLDQLNQLPVPFIAQVKNASDGQDMFMVVSKIDDTHIHCYNPEKQKWEKRSRDIFLSEWVSRIVLIADAEDAEEEKDFIFKKRGETRMLMARYFTFLLLPALTLILLSHMLWYQGMAVFFPLLFALTTLVGCITGVLLLMYEQDQYNPVLQQICSAGKKINCGAILHSSGAKVGGVSWSVIGISYFSGSLLFLLFTGVNTAATLTLLSLFSILAAPYILYSIYYQGIVARQWCVLCLLVQLCLAIQFAIVIGNGWLQLGNVFSVFQVNTISSVVLSYSIPFIVLTLLLPALQADKENKHNILQLQRLKHNPQIFDSLLSRQKKITEDTDGIGIILGNSNATQKIVKVCNPYCGPCAKAHMPMEMLLTDNTDIQVRIIFTATNDNGDVKALPVKHLLAIAEKGDSQLLKQALDDWYLAPEKNYEAFAARYPMNGELKQQDAKVEAMQNWCNKMEISFTPTFFINNHQLPAMYSVNDLKYFLSV